ncbi:XRE family transcriptional regulator [uncultured Jannaschia sp.]|uniref:ImmA/IrrE family metallo-endopeptidase n=1 Tax=uncultured Jannaschia sp. TaxID=293347 RepID=UPI00260AF90E|nr:XRE family transcriptional regulator [uncultured Jannaschia sp.]
MTIDVKPAILVWTRETAGLSVEDAASKIGLTTSAKSSAAEKLEAMERGEKQPTRGQLNSMAKVYRRPLLTFYLQEPPRVGPYGTDFRQTPEKRGAKANGLLNALLRDVRARQETVRDILEEEDDYRQLAFVGSVRIEQGVANAVHAISTTLGFDPTAIRTGNADALFKRLRAAAEEAGVFVLVLGDLGNHHSTVDASVFRGFAIADDVAPFVVINAKDAKPARSFTLIHELAHVFLGQTGVSGTVTTGDPTTHTARIERFCNDVAGELLLPGDGFRAMSADFSADDASAAQIAIEAIAARWSVSEPMVAYRLHRIGRVTSDVYDELRAIYHVRWQTKVAKDNEGEREINQHVVKQSYLGNALLGLVHRYVRDHTLSHTKAAALLGSRPASVEPLLRHFESNRGRFVAANRAAV